MEVLIVWVVIMVAAAVADVAFRSSAARRRGEDGFEAGRRAGWEAFPVVAARLGGWCDSRSALSHQPPAGVGMFIAIASVVVFVMVAAVLTALGGGDASGLDAVLVGLPLGALALVASVRRSQRLRGE